MKINDMPPSYNEVMRNDAQNLRNNQIAKLRNHINLQNKKPDKLKNLINAILEMLGLADFKFEENIRFVDKKIAENILNEKNIDAVNNKEDKITALHSLVSNGMTTENTMELIIALLDKGARTDIRAGITNYMTMSNKTVKEMVENSYKGYLVQKYLFNHHNFYIQNKNGLGDQIVEKVLGKELMNSIKDQYTTFINKMSFFESTRIKERYETDADGAEKEARNLIESNAVEVKFDLTEILVVKNLEK
jgi:hypothetical protein